jgi:hypothetical protein
VGQTGQRARQIRQRAPFKSGNVEKAGLIAAFLEHASFNEAPWRCRVNRGKTYTP